MADDTRPGRISARTFLNALCEAGVLRKYDYVRRVVIDAEYDSAVVVHVERYGDDRLLQVVRTLEGVEVREEARAESGGA